MQKLILLLCLFFAYSIHSQEYDTIKFDYRTGRDLDSVDFANASNVSSFVGGIMNTKNQYSVVNHLTNISGLNPFFHIVSYPKLKFSAIPHLGFSYSFGSQSIQFVHFDYQQMFGKTLLNMNLNRSSSNGVMRNSQFTLNDFSIQLNRKAKFYSFLLQTNQFTNDHKLNGGYSDLTYINDQGLSFVPVNYSQANATVKSFTFEIVNQFNFVKDSLTEKKVGLITKHSYSINSRVFNDLTQLSTYFIDSTTTRDQFRYAETEQKGGLFYGGKNLKFDGLLGSKYWDYQNLGRHMDTTEISLYSDLSFQRDAFKFKNSLKKNFVGAFGEYNNEFVIGVFKRDRSFEFLVDFGKFAPYLYQRQYFSNAYNYKLNNIELQGRNRLGFRANLLAEKNVKSLNLSCDFYQLENNYFFIQNSWRNDTLSNFSIVNVALNSDLQFKKLKIQPKFTLNFTKGIAQYLPTSKIDLRLVLQSKLFKAKKLEGMLGVDLTSIASFNLLSFNSYIGVFSVSSNQQKFNTMLNGSFFAGFEIDEFRMYLKVDNIGYFFNEKSNQTILGYPIQPNFIRLGITWDFFN